MDSLRFLSLIASHLRLGLPLQGAGPVSVVSSSTTAERAAAATVRELPPLPEVCAEVYMRRVEPNTMICLENFSFGVIIVAVKRTP